MKGLPKKNNNHSLKNEREKVGLGERLFWIITGLLLFYSLVSAKVKGRSDILVLQLAAEFLICLILPALKLIVKQGFVERLSFKVQTHICIMLLVTAFFGQYLGLYSSMEWYDTYMHIIGGFVFVFTGYELAAAMKSEGTSFDPLLYAIAGFGLSFFFAVGWEIFEFVCDSVFVDSNSQNWSAVNSEGVLKLFSNIDPRRYALLDTMLDLVAGTLGSLAGGVALYIVLKKRNKSLPLKTYESTCA